MPRKKENTSTSTRVERGTLSRELILRKALAIVDEDGLGGMTTRKLAARLGVTPMAIYRHYKNKAAIEHELVDLVVGDYDVTNHAQENWREWVCTSCVLIRHALCAHPGIVPLLDGATYNGSNALVVMEKVLGVLSDAGLSAERAAIIFHTSMAYTIGAVVLMSDESRRSVVEEKNEEDSNEQLRQRKLVYEMAPRAEYPNIVKMAAQLALSPEDSYFRKSLMSILLACEV